MCGLASLESLRADMWLEAGRDAGRCKSGTDTAPRRAGDSSRQGTRKLLGVRICTVSSSHPWHYQRVKARSTRARTDDETLAVVKKEMAEPRATCLRGMEMDRHVAELARLKHGRETCFPAAWTS